MLVEIIIARRRVRALMSAAISALFFLTALTSCGARPDARAQEGHPQPSTAEWILQCPSSELARWDWLRWKNGNPGEAEEGAVKAAILTRISREVEADKISVLLVYASALEVARDRSSHQTLEGAIKRANELSDRIQWQLVENEPGSSLATVVHKR